MKLFKREKELSASEEAVEESVTGFPDVAEWEEKGITGIGISSIANPIVPEMKNAAWKGSYVYFGRYQQQSGNNDADNKAAPIKWRVLNTGAGDDFSISGGAMLLHSDIVLDRVRFNEAAEDARDYDKCNVRKWLNSESYVSSARTSYTRRGFLNTAFTETEKSAVAKSTKSGKDDKIGCVYYDDGGLSQNETADYIFLLSAEEMITDSYGYYHVTDNHTSNRTAIQKATDFAAEKGVSVRNGSYGEAVYWWLRSTCTNYDYPNSVGVVDCYGELTHIDANGDDVGVSPAFNLNLSSVLFTSALEPGTAGRVGAEYKLTLIDSDISISVNGVVRKLGDTVTIPYSITGKNADIVRRVSVLVLDGKYTDNANVKDYKKLKIDNFSKSGEGTYILTGDMQKNDYYYYIVAEAVYDKCYTDYASVPVPVTIPQGNSGIDSVELSITAPVGGFVLASNGAASAKELTIDSETPEISWTKGGEAVSGKALYNTTYKASVTLSADTDYAFAQVVAVTVNGINADSENIVRNNDTTITVSHEFTTASAKLISITQPRVVTASYGAARTAEALGLPKNISIVTEAAEVTEAAVTWNLDNFAKGNYDPNISTEQSFAVSGTITLPDGIDANGNSLKVTVGVKVEGIGIVYEAKGYDGFYDGNPHSITVAVTEPKDAVVTYCETKDGTYSEKAPAYTGAGKYTTYFKIEKDKTFITESADVIITKSAKNAPTGLTAEPETISGKGDGRIAGLTTEMEYSRTEAGKYEAVSASDMAFAAGIYYIRYAETDKYDASQPTSVEIEPGEKLQVILPEETVGYKITTEDSLSLDYGGEFTFKVKIETGYIMTGRFAVKVNGESIELNKNITLNEDGSCTISGIAGNRAITVEGISPCNEE